MNINDVDANELWPTVVELYKTDDPLEIIFARQRELMGRYLILESEILSERLITIPVDVHGARGQRTLKERTWWVVEELVEALDAMGESDETKFLEEMSDALHFITELLILSGLDASTLPQVEANPFHPLVHSETRLGQQVMDVIKSLGRAMWQLRNKSWKKSQVLTDVPRFTANLLVAYKRLLLIYSDEFGLNMQQICLLYLRKSEVNKFRQRSDY